MSYETERTAISTFLAAQWGATTPIGYEGHPFEPEVGTPKILMSILDGVALQGTIGKANNRIDYVGILNIKIFTDGGAGETAWRGYAETLCGIFRNKILDNAGAVITSPADAFVRFSPAAGSNQVQHPHVLSSRFVEPFNETIISAPFVRYEHH